MQRIDRIRYPAQDLMPQRMIRAMFIMILTVVTLVALARLTDRPREAQPPRGPVLSERVVHIWGNTAGEARITDADGDLIAEFGTGKANFISVIDRVIRRERGRYNADPDGPLHLRLRAGNRLALFDPGTGRETELASFGNDNVASFSDLLTAE